MFIVNRVFSYFWMPFYLMSLLTFGSFLLVLPCSFPWLTLKTGEVFFIMFIAGHSEDQRICSTGRHICIVFVFGFCLFCSALQHTYIYKERDGSVRDGCEQSRAVPHRFCWGTDLKVWKSHPFF